MTGYRALKCNVKCETAASMSPPLRRVRGAVSGDQSAASIAACTPSMPASLLT